MSTIEDIARERHRIRAEFGTPILRIELGRRQLADLMNQTLFIGPSDAATPRILGVPYVAMPLDDHFRIVREGDDD